jgi:hypothetical protein
MGKPGRPPGARNYARIRITAQPVYCPECHATDWIDRRVLSRSYLPGQFGGHPYTHVTRYSLRCRVCDTRIELICHEHVPRNTPGKKTGLF